VSQGGGWGGGGLGYQAGDHFRSLRLRASPGFPVPALIRSRSSLGCDWKASVMRVFRSSHADAVWREAWTAVREDGIRRANAAKGDSMELLHCSFGIDDARQRWVLSRTPPLNPAFAIAEIVWILNGRRDAAFLTAWNTSLGTFAGNAAELHGAYGHRLKSHLGFDQLRRAAEVLSADSDQRQVVLQVWDSTVDFPNSDGSPTSEDVPCNICAIVKVSDGRLEWLQVMRSNDLVLGLPYNLLQWTTLQEVLAGWLQLEVGTYNHISDSLHVYDRDFDRFDVTAGSSWPRNDDDLRLPLEQSLEVFAVLEDAIESLGGATTSNQVLEVLDGTDVPEPYKNLLLVMASERCRRLGSYTQAISLFGLIKNEAIAACLRMWYERLGFSL